MSSLAALGKAVDNDFSHLFEAINDASAWHQVGICDVCPVCNFVYASTVLGDHRVADVSKLPVLKDHEVCISP